MRTRPRFVAILAVAAAGCAVYAAAQMPEAFADDAFEKRFLGVAVGGRPALALAALEPVLYLAAALGLWLLQSWARWVAMGYLAYVIVEFLLFGVGPSDGRRATAIMFWQISVIPFATFCFMFLYDGARYFGRVRLRPTAERSTLARSDERAITR